MPFRFRKLIELLFRFGKRLAYLCGIAEVCRERGAGELIEAPDVEPHTVEFDVSAADVVSEKIAFHAVMPDHAGDNELAPVR